jgi:hypothetical protein
LSGKSDPAATGAPLSVSPTGVTAVAPVAANSNTPTPAASDFKYSSQLEIVGDSDASFPQDKDVTLEWKLPRGVAALDANEAYVVRITYQDANGQSQAISLTTATTQITLPREKFFANGQPVAAKDTPYQWAVAVAARLADQMLEEISPRTSPLYTFYWMANPPTRPPSPSVTPAVAPLASPAPTLGANVPTPVCPSAQFYDPVMERCRGIPGQGPEPTSKPKPKN